MDVFDLLDFQRFLSDSVSWYYKNIIGIFLDDESVALRKGRCSRWIICSDGV